MKRYSHSIQAGLVVVGLFLTLTSGSLSATGWLQFGFDQRHSGNNAAEKGYPTATGNELLYKVYVPLATGSQPVELSHVATASGFKDLLFINGEDGSAAAIDASDGSTVWTKTTSGAARYVRGGPAIDPNLAFVYSVGLDGKIHKYSVGDGSEVVDAHWPETSSLKPDVEDASSSLSIATDSTNQSYLYAVVNGYGDAGDYQGHITAINLNSGTQTVFNTQCSNLIMHFVENGSPRVNDCDLEGPNKDFVDGQMSGIWGRPGVVFDEQLNRIYAATGNGLFDANTSGGFEWGDSVLALHPDGSGSGMGWPVDSYTPGTFAQLYSDDWDLGSTSPAIVPSTSAKYPHIALQGGKDACLRLINLDDMSGLSGPGHVGGELYLTCGGQYLGPIFGQPAVWVNSQDNTTWLFVPTHGGQLLAFQLVVDSLGDVSLDQKWASPDMVIGSPIIAGGVLYYEGIKDAISNHLTAVDPTTGSIIWGDVNNGGNWQCPVVTNGHIYFLDAYSQLSAYLLDGIFKDGMSD